MGEKSIFTSLLFAQGGQPDARNLSAKAGNFLRDELRKVFELFTKENIEKSLSALQTVKFVTEIPEDKKEIRRLYKNPGQGIGYLGNAATTIAFPIVTIILAMSTLLGAGGSAYAAIKLGERREEDAEKTLGTVFILTLISSAVIMVLEIGRAHV